MNGVRQCSGRDAQRAVLPWGYASSGTITQIRGGGIRSPRMGPLVEQPPPVRTHRKHLAAGANRTSVQLKKLKPSAIAIVNQRPANPTRFSLPCFVDLLLTWAAGNRIPHVISDAGHWNDWGIWLRGQDLNL